GNLRAGRFARGHAIDREIPRPEAIDPAILGAARDWHGEEKRFYRSRTGRSVIVLAFDVMKQKLFLSLFLFTAFSFLSLGADDAVLPPKAALDAIKADQLLKHIKVLASDE